MAPEELVPVGDRETKFHPPAPPSDDSDSSDEDMTDEQFRFYMDQLLKSGGFDVPSFPGVSMYGQIHPMDIHIKPDGFNYDGYSQLAVDEYNRRFKDANGELEFVNVLKAMYHGSRGLKFYLTFEAKDLSDHGGKVKTYQAVVLRGIDDTTSVLSFRLKPPEDNQGSGNHDEVWFWKGHIL